MIRITDKEAISLLLIVSNRRLEFLAAANELADRGRGLAVSNLTAAERLTLSALIAAIHVADTVYSALDAMADDGGEVEIPSLIAEWVILAAAPKSAEVKAAEAQGWDADTLARREAAATERFARLSALARRIAG